MLYQNQNDLIHNLATRLQQRQWQLVTIESCTGGLVAAHLTEVSGSSLWFERGYVTYSNRAKEDLSVPKELIARFGAVSEEVAKAMAEGALKHSKAQIALAVTGIAGPTGGSLEKPVGLICFAFAALSFETQGLKKQFSGNRHQIRAHACQEALMGVFSFLNACTP